MKNLNIYKNKKIIITGHTGFKGSWLSLWLNYLGAKVYGISDKILTNPSNFKINSKNIFKESYFFDIKNQYKLKSVIKEIKPDFIFHLAAQALVKKSYHDPHSTFISNSIGTLNLLNSLKNIKSKKKCSIILITSDKSYKNREIKKGYVEEDLLGGHDPYSASKACAELIIKSYIESFFKKNNQFRIGIARAGNVIGGGDWSDDRLIPDLFRAYKKNSPLIIRNPNSTRPWQHVLEALNGYMILGQKLYTNKKLHGHAFNFGPKNRSSISVIKLIKMLNEELKNIKWKIVKSKGKYESKLLMLNSKKALNHLNWQCVLKTDETIKFVVEWYKNFYSKKAIKMSKFSIQQIEEYTKIIKKRL